jgi:type I restriction enzyme S subunit
MTRPTATPGDSTPALTPKLRFPGFTESWTYEPLSKVLTEHKLKNTAGRDVFSVSMEFGIVNQIELLGRSFAAADTSHYTIGRRYDVVYTKSPLKAFPFGIVKQSKFDGEVALSPLYGVFTPSNPYLGLMIEAYFESPNRSKDFLAPLCQKGAKNTLQITNTTFLSGRLPLPTQPAEQQKIAECLSTLDELIGAESQKLDALKAHKKGLMQQLFPREGETLPRLRFPEFHSTPEWEEKSVGDLGDVVTGSTPSTAKREYYDGDVPFVSPSDISELRFVETTKTTLTELGFEETRPIRAGSTVFVCIGSTIGKVAQIRRGSATNQQINSVVPNSDHDDAFVYYALVQNADRVAKLAGIQAVPIVNKSLFSAVRLPVPKRNEQHRIATCLSSLDDLVAAQSDRLAALQTHKQGLLQQLFPSPASADA